MRAEILPFTDEHVADAGRLLAGRHARHRSAQPLLDPRFEDPSDAEAEVAAAWKSDDASGAVAVRDGEVVAYLLGAPKDDPTWGPNLWVESAGMATGPEAADAELMRDVYAAAAVRWVDEGRTAHYVLVPAYDEGLVGAWFRLGFGHQQTHALRTNREAPPELRPGLTVRPAERDDIPALARLQVELPRHQGLSPCFSAGRLETVEEAQQEWEEDWGDPDFPTWVAVHDGRVVGSAIGCALTKSSGNNGLIRPAHAGFLGFAAVLPEARGLGAGRALGETVMHWSGEAATTASRPTGASRTCCPRARGPPSASSPRSSGCTARSATERRAAHGPRSCGSRLPLRRPGPHDLARTPPHCPDRGNPVQDPSGPVYCVPVHTTTYFFGYPPGAPARAAC